MKKRIHAGISLLAFAALMSCKSARGPKGPEQTVRSYIETSFSVKEPSGRKKLLEFLAGDARSRLAAWSEEQFAHAFLDDKRKLGTLSFKETRTPSRDEALVTYELSYHDAQKARRTQRKVAELSRHEGEWKIVRVQNLRETVEYQNELTVP